MRLGFLFWTPPGEALDGSLLDHFARYGLPQFLGGARCFSRCLAHDAKDAQLITNMSYEFPWRVRNNAEFERSVAAAFPNGEWLATAIVAKFNSDIRVHGEGSASRAFEQMERVWEYGKVLVRYRLLPVKQMVEILSVTKAKA